MRICSFVEELPLSNLVLPSSHPSKFRMQLKSLAYAFIYYYSLWRQVSLVAF